MCARNPELGGVQVRLIKFLSFLAQLLAQNPFSDRRQFVDGFSSGPPFDVYNDPCLLLLRPSFCEDKLQEKIKDITEPCC